MNNTCSLRSIVHDAYMEVIMTHFRILAGVALVVMLSASVCAQSQHLTLDANSGLIYSTPGGLAGPSQAMTIECWIKINSLPILGDPIHWSYVIWQENDANAYPLFGFNIQYDGTLRLGYHNGSWSECNSTGTLDTQGWHHVAATFEATTDVRFYIDGALAGVCPPLAGPVSGSLSKSSLGFEDALDRQFLDGEIDEFRVWSVARSAQEIASSMFSSIGTAPNLLFSLSFEGTSVPANGGGTATEYGSPSYGVGPTPTFPPVAIGGGQANSPSAALLVNDKATGTASGPFASKLFSGSYASLDLYGSPNVFYEMYGSPVLSPGGWDFGPFGLFDLGTGPTFNDVFIVLPGFQNTFPFYALDSLGESHLSFYVHPALTSGSVVKVQAVIQMPQPWIPDPVTGIPVWGRLTAAHDLVIQ